MAIENKIRTHGFWELDDLNACSANTYNGNGSSTRKVIRVVLAIQLSYYVLSTINPRPSRSAGMPRSTTSVMATRVEKLPPALGQSPPMQSPSPRVRLFPFESPRVRMLGGQRLEYFPISNPFVDKIQWEYVGSVGTWQNCKLSNRNFIGMVFIVLETFKPLE